MKHEDEIIRESQTFKEIVQLVKEMKDPKNYCIDVGALGAATLDCLEDILFSEMKILIEFKRNTQTPQATLRHIRFYADTFFSHLISNVLITKSIESVDLKTLAIANLHYLSMVEEREKQDDHPKIIEFMKVRLNPELAHPFYLCNSLMTFLDMPPPKNFGENVKDLMCKYFKRGEHKMSQEENLEAFEEILAIKKNKYNKLHPQVKYFIFIPTTPDNQNETEAIFNNSDADQSKTENINDPIELFSHTKRGRWRTIFKPIELNTKEEEGEEEEGEEDSILDDLTWQEYFDKIEVEMKADIFSNNTKMIPIFLQKEILTSSNPNELNTTKEEKKNRKIIKKGTLKRSKSDTAGKNENNSKKSKFLEGLDSVRIKNKMNESHIRQQYNENVYTYVERIKKETGKDPTVANFIKGLDKRVKDETKEWFNKNNNALLSRVMAVAAECQDGIVDF